jgi:dTMP kinase
LFIAFEGPEGSGKSTQAKLLADKLRDAGQRVILTREPGGTQLGEELRRLLLDLHAEPVTPVAEALLYAAARAEHVAHLIRPALEAGEAVICDRFADSTLAYQGGGRGLDLEQLRAVQRFATGGVEPDLRILLDLPVAVGLARRHADHETVNRLDAESLAFHERVRAAYLAFARVNSSGWRVIDATQTPEQVAACIWPVVKEWRG